MGKIPEKGKKPRSEAARLRNRRQAARRYQRSRAGKRAIWMRISESYAVDESGRRVRALYFDSLKGEYFTCQLVYNFDYGHNERVRSYFKTIEEAKGWQS